MANKKFEVGAKSKAAPAAPPLEAGGQNTKTSENKLPATTPEPATAGKVEKGKKAQAAKKGNKAQQQLAQEALEDQSKAPTEMQAIAPSEVKLNNGEAKDKKAKGKKQVAVEPVVAEPVVPEPVAADTAPVSKKVTPEQASAKAAKMKRLTLDIAKPLHKAIKAKAVEEGIPMVDMLRSLLEEHYGK